MQAQDIPGGFFFIFVILHKRFYFGELRRVKTPKKKKRQRESHVVLHDDRPHEAQDDGRPPVHDVRNVHVDQFDLERKQSPKSHVTDHRLDPRLKCELVQ